MILTLKSSRSDPWKTVRPTPTMPGRTSSIGMIGVVDDVAREDIPERTARARTAAAVRVFICIWTLERARSDGPPERPPESVIESNRLQVKNKAAIVSGPCATCLPSATLAVPGRRPIGGARALLRGQTASHQARGLAFKGLFSYC